ncbi:MAG: hybrid sensor histidine kinase/response regulator [Candidatus Omnitrophica bacterium]|nr:hybrid sensor histidine kinase/response regulator [Candidatus Omnitrophota bacterium]
MAQEIYHILIIEDREDDALLMQKLLLKCSGVDESFQTVQTRSLSEAFQALSQDHFDLVLLDLSLPEAQDFRAFESIRAVAPHMPIVICAGIQHEKVAVDAISKGAQDYLIKGKIDQQNLARVLRYALHRSKFEKMRQEFVGMIVHELRSPLVVSMDSVAQILEGILGEITPDQKLFLTMAHDNMNRLNLLIDDILDMTKMELGAIDLKKSTFDLVELVKQITANFSSQARKKNIELKMQMPEMPVYVYADPEKIQQVLINLISNAVKFIESGYVEASIIDQGAFVECRIKDTGYGISQEDQKRLFDKFKQFGRRNKKGQKGTGLGLAICKGIMDAHQGAIRVESSEGSGACFIFTIPK